MAEQQQTDAPQEVPQDADSAILADLARGIDEDEAQEEAEEATEEAEETDEAETEDDDTAEAETEDDDTAEADEEEVEDSEEPEEDPELSKRLDQIQRQEKRAKEALAKERQELEQERQQFAKEREEWAPKVERFEELAKRAQFDPAAVLEALDVPEEMFEEAAKQIYARSQSGRKDPKLREQATQSLREREMQAKLDELEKNYRKLAEERKQEQERQAIRKQVEEYMGSVTQAVTEEHSIVHSMMQKAPEKARAQLEEAARYLYQQTGETPDPEDVVSTLEKARRAELEELGIEIPRAGKKPKTKPKAKASEKAVAKTLSSDLGTQTQPRDEPPSDEDIDAAILRDLKEGNVEI